MQLFHVSEQPGINIFNPRPSPFLFEGLEEKVVFAITGELLHNYLLPRDCPRVCFYAGPHTTLQDMDLFFKHSTARYIIAIENGWLQRITSTMLYCYEMPAETFALLDECAGYYVSRKPVKPLRVKLVTNILIELLKRDTELRFLPTLWPLANAVKQSTLQFSLIRMRNAATIK